MQANQSVSREEKHLYTCIIDEYENGATEWIDNLSSLVHSTFGTLNLWESTPWPSTCTAAPLLIICPQIWLILFWIMCYMYACNAVNPEPGNLRFQWRRQYIAIDHLEWSFRPKVMSVCLLCIYSSESDNGS